MHPHYRHIELHFIILHCLLLGYYHHLASFKHQLVLFSLFTQHTHSISCQILHPPTYYIAFSYQIYTRSYTIAQISFQDCHQDANLRALLVVVVRETWDVREVLSLISYSCVQFSIVTLTTLHRGLMNAHFHCAQIGVHRGA